MTSSGWCHGDTLGGPRRCRELVLNTRSLARRGCEICAYDPFLRQGSRAVLSKLAVEVRVDGEDETDTEHVHEGDN